jgi:hypothetical protein
MQVLHFDPNVRAVAEYLDSRKATAIFNMSDCSSNLTLARGGHCVSYFDRLPNPSGSSSNSEKQNKRNSPSRKSPAKAPLLLLNGSVTSSGVASSSSTSSLVDYTPFSTGSVRAMVPVLHNRHVCFQYTLYQEQIRMKGEKKYSSIIYGQSSMSSPSASRGNVSSSNGSNSGIGSTINHHGIGGLGLNHGIAQYAHAVSVGLSTSEMPVDSKYGCGSHPNSIGISGSGVLYINGKEMMISEGRRSRCFGNRSTVC